MKRILAVTLCVIMLIPTFVSCNGNNTTTITTSAITQALTTQSQATTPKVSAYDFWLAQSLEANKNVMDYFWNSEEKHFKKYTTSMVWEVGVALFGIETIYNATGDNSLKEYFSGQMAYMEYEWDGTDVILYFLTGM